jgi:hypothetical protein
MPDSTCLEVQTEQSPVTFRCVRLHDVQLGWRRRRAAPRRGSQRPRRWSGRPRPGRRDRSPIAPAALRRISPTGAPARRAAPTSESSRRRGRSRQSPRASGAGSATDAPGSTPRRRRRRRMGVFGERHARALHESSSASSLRRRRDETPALPAVRPVSPPAAIKPALTALSDGRRGRSSVSISCSHPTPLRSRR